MIDFTLEEIQEIEKLVDLHLEFGTDMSGEEWDLLESIEKKIIKATEEKTNDQTQK